MIEVAAAHIPVIDINSKNTPESAIAQELLEAAIDNGFVYIKNNGQDIPIEAIDKTFQHSRLFFHSPIEEKETCAIQLDNAGWSGMHTETLDAKTQRIGDFKEAFNLHEFKGGRAQQPLPPSFVAHEEDLGIFSDYCRRLCLRLLKLFASALHIDPNEGGENWLSERHDPKNPSACLLRLLHYPSIPETADYQPDVDVRAGAHSDYGSITLLFQRPGQPGLEILTDGEEGWVSVAVHPATTEHDPGPPILVNIGDLLSHWTNGLLKSTVHRVIFPKGARRGGEDRYSIAYFCHPANSTLLVPIPSEMVKSHQPKVSHSSVRDNGKVEVLTAWEHLQKRLAATYLNLPWEKAETKDGTTSA